MTDCDHISDRMPDVAAGRARWGAGDESHLASCEECRHAWDIVRGTARLGTGTELQLDEATIADAVLRRLHGEPSTTPSVAPSVAMRRRAWAFAGVSGAAAAAAGLVLLLRTPAEPSPPPVSVAARESTTAVRPLDTARLELSVPELDDVPVESLGTVLRSVDRPFRADELLESNWGEVENREFARGFSTVSYSEE